MANALGRSRGGFGTKACLACDAAGQALAFRFLPGHRSELKASDALLVAVAQLGRAVAPRRRVICDRVYSSASWCVGTRRLGAEPVVPANRSRPAVAYDRRTYRLRTSLSGRGAAVVA